MAAWHRTVCVITLALLALAASGRDAHAQALGDDPLGALNLGATEPALEVTLTPRDAQPGDEVRLALKVILPPGSYTYSQDPSFSQPTKITISESPGLEAIDAAFVPNHEPKRAFEPLLNETVEKFDSDVTFSRRYRVRAGVDPASVYVRGELKHLVCDGAECTVKPHKFAVSLTGAAVPPPSASGGPAPGVQPVVFVREIRPTGTRGPHPALLQFQLRPENAKAGERVTLSVTLVFDDGWHGYALEAGPKQAGTPTELRLGAVKNLKPIDEFQPDRPPELYDGTERVYHDRVTFTRTFEVDRDEAYGLAGSVRFQVCDKVCLPPKTVEFVLGHVPADAATGATTTLGSRSAKSGDPAGTDGADPAPFQLVSEGAAATGLGMNLLFAFLGGLILNVMPCVLPVLAIKVLSFVQQAGESRGRVLALNAAYALGVLSIFLMFATLAVFVGTDREDLFQQDEFNLIMASIVFAMGLSLLGVFEIPVPGMIGSAAGGQHREGLTGAFVTGIFATILAIPCSGPFMGTTIAWTVGKPPHAIYLVWGAMGLGMASPYLVIGAFPALVNWLPKPGMWMVRFKEFAGFVLMAAVVWLLMAVSPQSVIPALVIFIGIALGLWMIGNLYDHSTPRGRKYAVRVGALVLAGGICAFGYQMQFQRDHLPWQPFSTARVEELRASGKPILIDFTADWCLICKTNERIALNRHATARFVEEHGIVPLFADFTKESPEIRRWLELSNQAGVPLTLIFPKGRPTEAIALRGLYTQGTLLAKLKEAVGGSPGAVGTETLASETHRTAKSTAR